MCDIVIQQEVHFVIKLIHSFSLYFDYTQTVLTSYATKMHINKYFYNNLFKYINYIVFFDKR